MADNWYYVQNKLRNGPVGKEVLEAMIKNHELLAQDYVWKKGFENWKKIQDVPELEITEQGATPQNEVPVPSRVEEKQLNLKELDPDERLVYIRIGTDRGELPTEYGPYSVNILKKLFKENRINAKTEVYIKGATAFKFLADLPEYQDIFEELPPPIQESDRRVTKRKPFIARLFVQNHKKLYEGICRDISVGGMQILMDEFQGKMGDQITINVHPQNSDYHFTASGIVVRLLEGNSGFSFRFDGLSDEAKNSIEKYLKEN